MQGSNFDLAPHDWATLRGLLDDALELPAGRREAWLQALDSRFEAFKPRLRALLAHVESPLADAMLNTLPKVETDQFAPRPGHRGDDRAAGEALVGPYRLLRQIGEGGMAAVWLAERTDVLQSRRVALKLPHGAWRRAGLAERMAREREILATLEHPHIARLYDAGVADDGQPYLALEFVEGERIDAYCRRHALGVRQRLGLFLQVAQAVAHAHANLVVHRDLKPSNILVTAEGGVRLLDFGIAKLLEQGVAEETALTRDVGRALTPDYAAPEQIQGRAIGTAADVYSLGVVLFELLTGRRPYQLKRESRAALEEAILQAEPMRPSEVADDQRVRRELRGDLDTIVLKALKKAPAERYATANALADDIERWLQHRPVLAQPDTTWYRTQKFVARNKLAIAAGAAVGLAIIVGAGISLWQALEARQQRDQALFQWRRAESSNDFVDLMLGEVGPQGHPLTLIELLDRGVSLLDRQTAPDAGFRGRMLWAMSRKYANLGNADKERALLARAEAIARDARDPELLATVQCSTARASLSLDPRLAAARIDESARLMRSMGTVPVALQIECLRARSLSAEAGGRIDDAIAALAQARELLRSAPVPMPQVHTEVLSDLAEFYQKTDRTDLALSLIDESLALHEQSGRSGSLDQIIVVMNRAAILSRAGEVADAWALQSRVAERISALAREGRAPVGFNAHFGASLIRLARYPEALKYFDAAAVEATQAKNDRWLAHAAFFRGLALLRMGRADEAQVLFAQAESQWRTTRFSNARMLNELELQRGRLARDKGDMITAKAKVDAVLAELQYPQSRSGAGLSSALYAAAQTYLAAGDAAGAERYARDGEAVALTMARKPEFSADVGQARLQRGKALAQLARQAEAATALQQAVASLSHGFGADHPETREARELLAALSK
jgi:serine/threonine-protein kinase